MGGRHSSIDSGPASVTAPPSPFSSGSSRHSGTASQPLDAFDRYPEPFVTHREFHTDHRPSLHTPSAVLTTGQRRLGPRIPHRYMRNSTGGNTTSGEGLRSEHSLHSHSPVPPYTGPANDSGAREVFGEPHTHDFSSSHFQSVRALSDNHIPNSVSGEQGTNTEEPHNHESLRTLQLLFASSALSDSSNNVDSSAHTHTVDPCAASPVSPPDFIDPLGVLAPAPVADHLELHSAAAPQSLAAGRTRTSLSTSGFRLVAPEERPPRTTWLPLSAARRQRPQSHSTANDASAGFDAAASTSRSMFSAFRRVRASNASSSAASSSGAGSSSAATVSVASASSAASASGATGRTPRDMRTRRLWEALGVGPSGSGGRHSHAAESSTSSDEGDEADAGDEHMGVVAGAGAHPLSLLPFINLPVAGTASWQRALVSWLIAFPRLLSRNVLPFHSIPFPFFFAALTHKKTHEMLFPFA